MKKTIFEILETLEVPYTVIVYTTSIKGIQGQSKEYCILIDKVNEVKTNRMINTGAKHHPQKKFRMLGSHQKYSEYMLNGEQVSEFRRMTTDGYFNKVQHNSEGRAYERVGRTIKKPGA